MKIDIILISHMLTFLPLSLSSSCFFLCPPSCYEGETEVEELKMHPLIVLIASRGVHVRVNFTLLHNLSPCVFIVYA